MKRTNYTVYRTEKGWAAKNNEKSRPAKYYDTQAQAYQGARRFVNNTPSGGDVSIKGLNGRFRAKHTIAPANDPHPPKG